MAKIALSTDLINNILQYLGDRPFKETVGLINQIQQEAQQDLAEKAAGSSVEITPESAQS